MQLQYATMYANMTMIIDEADRDWGYEGVAHMQTMKLGDGILGTSSRHDRACVHISPFMGKRNFPMLLFDRLGHARHILSTNTLTISIQVCLIAEN